MKIKSDLEQICIFRISEKFWEFRRYLNGSVWLKRVQLVEHILQYDETYRKLNICLWSLLSSISLSSSSIMELSSSASSMKIKVRMPQKNKPSLSDLGSLYVIYMIIIIKFHATEFPNMINLLRALRFTFEELFAFKRIFWHYQLLNSGFVNKQNKSPLVNLDQ